MSDNQGTLLSINLKFIVNSFVVVFSEIKFGDLLAFNNGRKFPFMCQRDFFFWCTAFDHQRSRETVLMGAYDIGVGTI
jgi:hypothetical protein